jgi:hypothetical protein
MCRRVCTVLTARLVKMNMDVRHAVVAVLMLVNVRAFLQNALD